MKKPKILIVDIETSAIIGDSWVKFDTNLHYIRKPSEVLSFAYQWNDKKTIGCETRQNQTERQLLIKLVKLINSADIVVAQNGDKFDLKKIRTRLAIKKAGVMKPVLTVDTLKIAKRYYYFDGNSLDDLARYFGIGRKLKHPGYDMWLGVEKNDANSWRWMKKYNKHDVFLTHGVYPMIAPYHQTHPNLNTISGNVNRCPKCLGKVLQKRGKVFTKTQVFQQYQCQKCQGWTRSRIADKMKKTELV